MPSAGRSSGAKCLVSWEKVCTMKEDGGLGIKRLDTQNACLLLKLVHRLHPRDSSWATWAKQRVRLVDLQGDIASYHWEALRSLMPAYRSISYVKVGDGSETSFWEDQWTIDNTLVAKFLALHTHFVGGDMSV